MFLSDLLRLQENKTALYWAVEKGNATMVRDILQCNPDTETCTKVNPLDPRERSHTGPITSMMSVCFPVRTEKRR